MNTCIQEALREKRNLLEHEALQLLQEYGIPVPGFQIVNTYQEAIKAAIDIGYPVTIKVVSQDILHKSDVGGVINGIKSNQELEKAWKRLRDNLYKNAAGARIKGFLITAFCPDGVECISGIMRDCQFGTAILFGLGGIFTEILQDTSLGLLPLTKGEAYEMISSIRGKKILNGYRGMPVCNKEAIVELLLNLARMASEIPEIKELDINPFLARESGVLAVDARVLLNHLSED